MEIILTVFGAAGIIMTAVPLLKADAWWIRIFDFPRLQIVFVLAFSLGVYPLVIEEFDLGRTIFFVLGIAALVQQSYMMYPYTPFAAKQVQDARNPQPHRTLSLMAANVLMENRRAKKLLDIINEAEPDIVLLAETDDWWDENTRDLEKQYPYFVRQPQDNTYGMLLYSRLELVGPKVEFVVQEDVPSIHGLVRLRSGEDVEFRCLHPRPPVPSEDESSAPRDAELLIIGRQNHRTPRPFVVFGDLNDVAWSRTNYSFQNISGLLDPRVGRGFFHTFHAGFPLLRFPLDHVFHSNHFRLISFLRLGYFGSDHFPVYVKLSLEDDAEILQEEPVSDETEELEADQKIEFATGGAAPA